MSPKNFTIASDLDRGARQRLVTQWAETGRVLAATKRKTLANSTPEEHRQAVWDMSQLGGLLAPNQQLEKWSGLIEMQRWFARLRERDNE
jgi:hypothetical protein